METEPLFKSVKRRVVPEENGNVELSEGHHNLSHNLANFHLNYHLFVPLFFNPMYFV